MVRLTAALISAINDGADIASITKLTVPHRDLDQLVALEVCESLTRLDLSDNRLSSLEGIKLCTSLQWLSVAGNQLTSLKGVENLTKLTVLNASRNKLTSFNEAAALTQLRALILNDNEITTVCRLDRLVNLNTVVLSRNPIRNLGNFATKLLALKKLSLSHCQVQVLGSSLKRCVALEELRLAHNQLSSLPQDLDRNGRLSILDVGTNHLQTWSDILVLDTLHSIVNLNLRGNPLCSEDDYEDEVVKRLPHLQILDGHSFHDMHKNKGKKSKSKDLDLTKGRKSGTDLGNSYLDDEESEPKLTARLKQQNGEGAGDDTEDLSFLDLISGQETDPAFKQGADDIKDGGIKVAGKSKKRKDDSGVVSVLDVTRGRPSGSKSKKVSELLSHGIEIGTGGPSTWDDPSPSAPFVQTQVIAGMQRNDQAEGKPYSRWALKTKS